ncbi:DUF2769 domain-containing protein [Acidobacteriota bacterium]
MKRREFFEKCGQGTFAVLLAYFGLKYPVFAEKKKEMSRKDMVKKMLIKEMGKTPEEADAMIVDMEKKLPEVLKMCVCPKCPSYVKGDKPVGYCHPLVGKSKLIEKEKGCICGSCPVYKKMKMTKGYYCTRKSEMEQKMTPKK